MAGEPQEKDEMNIILFTNLQLLGMDVVDMEGIYKIPFNKDMFNLPNKAGSEAVLHFLFERLNPSQCREQFRDCWPVIDRKTELQFRKVCTNWLGYIQKDDPESHMPRVNAALLLSPGGRKFIHMMYSFSTYVLVQIMKSEHGWRAQDSLVYPVRHPRTASMGSVITSAIQDSAIREQNQFFEHLHLLVAANRQWKDYTNELVKEFRGLTKSYRDLEHEKRQQVNVIADNSLKQGIPLPAKRTITMFDSDQDAYAKKQKQRMEKARSQWNLLTEFSDHMTEEREIFQSVLNSSASRHLLDGTEMGIRVPGLLVRECSKEIHKREIDNVYSGGVLNLVSVVQLWNICLNLYKEQLQTETLPSVASEVPGLSSQAHKHHSHLRRTQELREEMRNHTLPKLRHSIGRLQKKLNHQCDFEIDTDENTNRLGLTLTGPTPPTMRATRTSDVSAETPLGPVAGPFVHIGSTPDALQIMFKKIDMAVQEDTSGSEHSNDGPFLSRLKNAQHRPASTRGSALPVSNSQPNEDGVKSRKFKDKSKTAKIKTKAGPQKGIHGTGALSHVSQQVNQKCNRPGASRGPRIATPASSKTAKSSTQKAMDALADTVVDSVLNHADSPFLTDVSADSLLDFGELDIEAFETRNLINRSPVENRNSEAQNSSESTGTRSFTAVQLVEDNLSVPRGSTDSCKKSPETSPQKSVLRSRNKDLDSIFDLISGDNDWSNNAAMSGGSPFPETRNSRNNTTFIDSAGFSLTENMFKNTPATNGSNATKDFVHLNTPFSENTSRSSNDRSGRENFSAFSGSFINNQHVFSSVDFIGKSPVTHYENGKGQSSRSLGDTSYFVSEDISALEKENGNQDTSRRLTRTLQGSIDSSPLDLIQSGYAAGETSSSDVSPRGRLRERKIRYGLEDVSDREPGDGQASADLNAQQKSVLSGVMDTDSDSEEVFDDGSLQSLSSLTLKHSSPPAPNTLRRSLHSSSENIQDSDKQNDAFGSWESPWTKDDKDSETANLQVHVQEESKVDSLSNENFLQPEEIHLENASQAGTHFRIADISEASEEKILDAEADIKPVLVHLDSEDDDLDLDQALNDSFIPFKEGICLENRSPARLSNTPSRASTQPPRTTDYTELVGTTGTNPAPSSENSIQLKLAALQQKAMDILSSCSEDYEFAEESSRETQKMTSENLWSQHAKICHASHDDDDDDDDDILSMELITTDLLANKDVISP